MAGGLGWVAPGEGVRLVALSVRLGFLFLYLKLYCSESGVGFVVDGLAFTGDVVLKRGNVKQLCELQHLSLNFKIIILNSSVTTKTKLSKNRLFQCHLKAHTSKSH